MSRSVLCFLPVLLTLALPVRAAVVPATVLETPHDAYDGESRAHAINSTGRIAVEGRVYAFSFDWAAVLLPPYPGGGSISLECADEDCFQEGIFPRDIAPDGRVVGGHAVPGPGYGPATWSPTGALTDLFSLPFQLYSIAAEGINGSGTIVGTGSVDLYTTFPALWEDWQASPETLPGACCPKAINGAGIIVGHTGGSVPSSAVWIPSGGGYSLSSLPLLPSGSYARAVDINGAGQIVGAADDGTGFDTAVVWEPLGGGAYAAVALPRLAAGQDCAATAINDSREVVGRCTDGAGAQRESSGTLRRPAVLHELEPLPGATLLAVTDVNDEGIAVGWSTSDSTDTAVLWSYRAQPVPALPGFGVLLLAAAFAATRARIARR
jgi:hypothetical protein